MVAKHVYKWLGIVLLTTTGGMAHAADAAEMAIDLGSRMTIPAAFWPDLSPATLAWFGAVIILALTLRLQPLACWRNIDGLVLAAMALLFPLRAVQTDAPGAFSTWQHLVYFGLAVATIYWVARGVFLLGSRRLLSEAPVSRSAIIVLMLVGFALCIHHIATGPLSDGSRDGLVGGIGLAETGKLPYGDAPGYDTRSPLLYIVHAGGVQLIEPTLPSEELGGVDPLRWSSRSSWLKQDWVATGHLDAARLVNGALLFVTLLGLWWIGQLTHGTLTGVVMVAIFCVFPGVREALGRPEIMLPTMLLTWTVAFALMPAVGGLLSAACLLLAGVAWPWAWLALPILLAYMFRRGWHAVGASIGFLGGAALCCWGLAAFVQPALVRDEGALRLAGMPPQWTAESDEGGTIIMRHVADEDAAADHAALSGFLWRSLLRLDTITIAEASGDLQFDWPNGLGGEDVLCREVGAGGVTRADLQRHYRDAVATRSTTELMATSLRTVLESTWTPTVASRVPVTPAWSLWAGTGPLEGRWLLIRRLVKLAVLLLSLLAALVIFFGKRTQPRHLIAGVLMVAGGTLLASHLGPAGNLPWLVAPALMLWAMIEPETAPAQRAAQPPRVASSPGSPRPGPEPRITYDN